jgi:hypothetical protein
MEKFRENLLETAKRMANKEIGSLRELRKMVVDQDLTKAASTADDKLFLALYLSKKLTGDVWANLFTDASFEFDEEKIQDFKVWLGEAVQGILSDEGLEAQLLADRLGKMTKFLYSLFYDISQNPSLVIKGERHESAGI